LPSLMRLTALGRRLSDVTLIVQPRLALRNPSPKEAALDLGCVELAVFAKGVEFGDLR